MCSKKCLFYLLPPPKTAIMDTSLRKPEQKIKQTSNTNEKILTRKARVRQQSGSPFEGMHFYNIETKLWGSEVR